MTKRFTLVDDDFISRIKDNGISMTAREIVECLNTLHEENEQLKTIINQLRTDNTKQKKKLNTAMKENEQLKEALFFYISVAITETSSHINEDLEKECNQLLNCSYKEALEKYDTSKYEGV